MKNENSTYTINLVSGYYEDKTETTHTEVTFGKRLTAGDLMNIEDNPQAALKTQHEELIRRQMITKFGSLKMPVPLSFLLSLDSIDRMDLDRAQDAFAQKSRGDKSAEFLDDNSVRLAYGFKIGDETYDTVKFGRRITGNDEVEADRNALFGVRRVCFLLGRQISEISSSEHSLKIEGVVSLEHFSSLDMEDLGTLRVGGEIAKQFFRIYGAKVQAKQNSGKSSDSGS